MRVVDLFCGAGLASHGLRMAGLEIVAGVDHWSTAAQSYKENFGRSHVCDIADVKSVIAAVGDTKPDVVWMSPPCTEHSKAKGARVVDERINLLAAHAARVAKRLAPRFIVCENHPGILKHRVFYMMTEILGADYGYPGQYIIDANVHLGGPARRERAFIVWTRIDESCPLLRLTELPADERGRAGQEVCTSFPVKPLDSGGLSLKTRQAMEEVKRLGGGVVTYNSRRGAHGWDEPHTCITTVQRHAYVYCGTAGEWGYRMADVADYRWLMGVPQDFVLRGTRREQFRQLGNGVDTRVSAFIGARLLEAAEFTRSMQEAA